MPGKDTSSSSGKIFAKPSKEWVLPERAKPGRKASTQEPESKRQSQNRMSQRAHRARRTDYIQTLEERLRQYEANEIHSNVRLQEVARALKADNDKLRSEVSALGSAIAAARKEREGWSAERRALNDTMRALRTQLNAARRSSSTGPSPRLDDRLEFELAALARSPALTPALSPLAATPRHAATPPFVSRPVTQQPDSLMCPICPDPDPDCPCQRPPSPVTTLPAPEPIPLQTLDSQLARTQRGTDLTLLQATTTLVASANCGMCDMSSLDCVCNEPEIEDIKPVIPRSPSPPPDTLAIMDMDCGLCTSSSFCACRAGLALVNDTVASAPATVPAPLVQIAAPAVPLRLRARAAAKQSVWKLDNVPAGQSRAEAVCTGDPSNCDACRNDRFGQEFCGHLFGVNDADNDNDKDKGDQKKGCAGCTKGKCGGDKGPLTARSMSISSLMDGPVPSPSTSAPATPGPVGDAPLVLTCCGAPELCGHAAGCDDSMPVEEETKPTPDETIRPDQAWKQLKAHPNAQFTPLAVLADVVARRTRCDGPRVELSPPPDERGLADARATLASHASKRRLAVETSAVRDALKYLDTHPHSAPGSPMSPAAKRRRML
ncbi:uncharacterized protein CcaverHIS019_0111780 [Cutaneotrichosporon cavernicola]|uniref:BZIP domain-containing protein n=1 Tax=Cutaneotrichosporon cavernicola TaxID=279322 RepID=A0AA48L0N7_9TREE|nr:uncharacterized protein CcaverHIS019_0111780 [Cutaneotrichosporon cavernicola]BEI88460.1 hypothetical protein CcaverHIS019_0111780 [Cutaneotrichosporon cavernicola]BEI96233.1 hypothetical protein CcaverHIS631_0111820 [Cutaneotrichosporon cavernicola]BEJ04004.1 hypothetical protein CcaverHIS641_0111790 [Cutaneotrichosporon cavernicola]